MFLLLGNWGVEILPSRVPYVTCVTQVS